MALDQPPAAETRDLPQPRANCAFCERAKLHNILFESAAFFLIADHAPLIEGHMLLVPKAHFACYGELAPALDAEFGWMKARASEFLARAYRPPVFFEHGIFRPFFQLLILLAITRTPIVHPTIGGNGLQHQRRFSRWCQGGIHQRRRIQRNRGFIKIIFVI